MIDVRENSAPGVLEIKITETVSEADFEHLEPVLEKYVAESSNPALLMIMEQFSGWESATAFWKDIKLDVSYLGKFNHIAVVGDATWEEWGTKLINPLTSSHMKFFKPEETQYALRWLQQQD